MKYYFGNFGFKGDEKVRWIAIIVVSLLSFIAAIVLTNDYFDKFEWIKTLLTLIMFSNIIIVTTLIIYLTRDKGDSDDYY